MGSLLTLAIVRREVLLRIRGDEGQRVDGFVFDANHQVQVVTKGQPGISDQPGLIATPDHLANLP